MRASARQKTDYVQIGALAAVTLGVVLLLQSLGLDVSGEAFVWPLVLAGIGTALIVGRSGRPIDE